MASRKKTRNVETNDSSYSTKTVQINETGGSISFVNLPADILGKIIALVCSFPRRFHLCCVSRDWNMFVHNHFENIGVVDVPEYLYFDNARNIMEQIEFLVKRKGHKLKGMMFKCTDEAKLFRAALKLCIGMDTFEVFRFKLRSDQAEKTPDRRILKSIIAMVQKDGVHLTDLSLAYRGSEAADKDLQRMPLDLSKMTKLQSLSLRCCTLSRWPTSVRQISYDAFHCTPLQLVNNSVISGNADALRYLVIDFDNGNVHYDYDDLVEEDGNYLLPSIQLPNIESFVVVKNYWIDDPLPRICRVNLSGSVKLERLEIQSKYVEIEGLDFALCPGLVNMWVMMNDCTDCIGQTCISSFANAQLHNLVRVVVQEVAFSRVIIARLALGGCEKLKVVELTVDSDDNHSVWSMVTSLVEACDQLESVKIIGLKVVTDDLVDQVVALYRLDNRRFKGIKVDC